MKWQDQWEPVGHLIVGGRRHWVSYRSLQPLGVSTYFMPHTACSSYGMKCTLFDFQGGGIGKRGEGKEREGGRTKEWRILSRDAHWRQMNHKDGPPNASSALRFLFDSISLWLSDCLAISLWIWYTLNRSGREWKALASLGIYTHTRHLSGGPIQQIRSTSQNQCRSLLLLIRYWSH
jgi:hypothetical protein